MRTPGRRKKFYVGCVVTIVSILIMPLRADELPSPESTGLKLDGIRSGFDSITNELLQLATGVDARWDSNTNAYYQIIVEQNADRPYKTLVPSISPGRPARQVDVKGPAPDGFSVRIRFRQGKYHEPLLRPTKPSFEKKKREGAPDFYSETVLTEFPEQNLYMVTDIQFGESVDTTIVSRTYELLQTKTASAVRSGDPGR
jgi:hypothetical protein